MPYYYPSFALIFSESLEDIPLTPIATHRQFYHGMEKVHFSGSHFSYQLFLTARKFLNRASPLSRSFSPQPCAAPTPS